MSLMRLLLMASLLLLPADTAGAAPPTAVGASAWQPQGISYAV